MRGTGGKKIVFFDSWTKGVRNLLPLQSGLSVHGVECLLIHRGSWGAEPNRPTEEVIEGLCCRDIRRYHGLVYAALRSERPNLVVIDTTNYIADRSVILAARALGIQSCFIMHGIRHISMNGREADEAASKHYLRSKRWRRAVKYFRHTIPDYFLSGVAEAPSFAFQPGPYWALVKTFLSPERHVLYPDPSPELHCDRALVWAEAYKDLFVEDYGYPAERVRVVGHPPLDPVFRIATSSPPSVAERNAFLSQHGIPASGAFTVYLEDAFVESGYDGWTVPTRVAHLEEIARASSGAGRVLVIKVHPTTEMRGIREHFSADPRVRVIGRTDLPRLISLAESVIGHVSSTVDIAISLRKPVLVPRWGISTNVPDLFVHRGVALPCDSPDALRDALQDPHRHDAIMAVNVQHYIARFITWQDGNSVERIVKSLLEQLDLWMPPRT